jgi:ADP-ribosylation factor 2-binding protein
MSPEDEEFDTIVGAMQEVLVSEEFEKRQNDFIKNHCMKFVETEENTHEMWMIHKKFKEEIEKYLETVKLA